MLKQVQHDGVGGKFVNLNETPHPELVSGSISSFMLWFCCTMDAETSSAGRGWRQIRHPE
jgi:hypothetical protein